MPKMPANNRMHSSAALQTHGIWANTIGYDPHAPSAPKQAEDQPAPNTFDSFKGLLALARLTGSASTTVKGQCKKCGGAGHLTFQCRNHLRPTYAEDDVDSTSSDSSDSESDERDKPGVKVENTITKTISNTNSSNSNTNKDLAPSKQSHDDDDELHKEKLKDKKDREHKHKHSKHKHKKDKDKKHKHSKDKDKKKA